MGQLDSQRVKAPPLRGGGGGDGWGGNFGGGGGDHGLPEGLVRRAPLCSGAG
jgi:hypothetical protein